MNELEPRRIWWARPRKLAHWSGPEEEGGATGPERREAEIAYLKQRGVRLVVSVMATRHNLADYERAGLESRHLPLKDGVDEADLLDELLPLLRRERRARGALALHGNRHTDFVAAACAAHLHELRGANPRESPAAAEQAGLRVTPEACALVGA